MPEFDESPWTPDELLMMRSGEAIKIPAAQADESLAMIYRKAAAYDRLSAIMARGRSACLYPPGTASQRRETRSTYLVVSAGPFSVVPNPSAVYTSDNAEAPTLLEAIEALPTNGEPKQ